MDLNQVLQKPIITEKSLAEAQRGQYTFAVTKDATKREVKKAVENQFKVRVVGIKTMIIKGKTRRVGRRRQEIKRSPWKKAIVQLLPEQKIDLFEVGAKE